MGGADGPERVVLFVMAVVSIHIWSSEVAAHGMRVKVWGGKEVVTGKRKFKTERHRASLHTSNPHANPSVHV